MFCCGSRLFCRGYLQPEAPNFASQEIKKQCPDVYIHHLQQEQDHLHWNQSVPRLKTDAIFWSAWHSEKRANLLALHIFLFLVTFADFLADYESAKATSHFSTVSSHPFVIYTHNLSLHPPDLNHQGDGPQSSATLNIYLFASALDTVYIHHTRHILPRKRVSQKPRHVLELRASRFKCVL